jgi:hypothetical protein
MIGCSNDKGVQDAEEALFDGQPCMNLPFDSILIYISVAVASLTLNAQYDIIGITWRGTSHNPGVLLFDEYLQFCYFMLYLCVAGIPFGFWLMGYYGTKYSSSASPAHGNGNGNDGISSSIAVTPSGESPSPLPSSSSSSHASPTPSDDSILATPRGPAMFTPMVPIGNGWVARQRAKLLRDVWYGFDLCLVALLVASYSCWVIYFIHPV